MQEVWVANWFQNVVRFKSGNHYEINLLRIFVISRDLKLFKGLVHCRLSSRKNNLKQECIPVGCVPAARWSYAGVCFPWGGMYLVLGGVPGPGGCVPGPTGGVPGPRGGTWSQGCVPGPRGVCLVRGCLIWGRGCGIPACTEADIPPVNRMNEREV